MLGQIISAKVAAVVLAGAVVTGGAAAAAHVDNAVSSDHRAGTAAEIGAANGRTSPQGQPEAGDNGKGQGGTISALAKSIPGGPGKGAQISAAAKGHGQTVSADAKANAKGGKPATPASPSAKPTN